MFKHGIWRKYPPIKPSTWRRYPPVKPGTWRRYPPLLNLVPGEEILPLINWYLENINLLLNLVPEDKPPVKPGTWRRYPPPVKPSI